MIEFSHETSRELVEKTKQLLRSAEPPLLEVLCRLNAISNRRAYAEPYGFPSLELFSVVELFQNEAQSDTYFNALRVFREIYETAEAIEKNEVNLESLALLGYFMHRSFAKKRYVLYADLVQLLEKVKNKSGDETLATLSKEFEGIPFEDFRQVRPVSFSRRLYRLTSRLTGWRIHILRPKLRYEYVRDLVYFRFHLWVCRVPYFFMRSARRASTLSWGEVFRLRRKNYLAVDDLVPRELTQKFHKIFYEKLESKENQNLTEKMATEENKPSNAVIGGRDKSFFEYWIEQNRILDRPVKMIPGLHEAIYQYVVPNVERLMGAFCCIERVCVFETTNRNGKPTYNFNGLYHVDGSDPKTYVKVIVYLSDVDENNGPFKAWDEQLKKEVSIEGRAGKTIFFHGRKLTHRGANTISSPRLTLVMLFSPSVMPQERVNHDALNVFYRKNPFLPYGDSPQVIAPQTGQAAGV